jgi:hypothetical protein
MATTYKVLGQAVPAATTAAGAASSFTTLYTVPSLTSTVVSTISVSNQSTSAITYRVAVRVAGAADTPKQYIAYDVVLGSNATDTLTLGVTLATTDVISIAASSTSVSFNAFGSEIA